MSSLPLQYNPDILLGPQQMQRCFMVSYNHRVGTCFIFQDNERAFFLSADHIFSGMHIGENVLFRTLDGWRPFQVNGYWSHPTGYDVCAFTVAGFNISGAYSTQTGCELFPGEPLKFLGFPHGLNGNYPGQGLPTPLVRTAYFSGVIEIEGKLITVLDGFNNPGYSGGPVFAMNNGQASIFAIISGYRPEQRAHGGIYKLNEYGVEERLPDIYTKPNSGMILSIGIAIVRENLFPIVDNSLFVQM